MKQVLRSVAVTLVGATIVTFLLGAVASTRAAPLAQVSGCLSVDPVSGVQVVGSLHHTAGRCVASGSAASARTVSSQDISFPGTQLTGQNQAVAGSTTTWQVFNSYAASWSVTIAATDFSAGSRSISVGNFQVKLDDANIVAVSGGANPSSQITGFAALSTTAQTLLSAAPPNGFGSYQFTPDFQLLLPADAYTGAYSATVTVTAIAGP